MASLTKKYTQKKESGRVYTPTALVEQILDLVDYTGAALEGKKILDPACGDGQFLTVVAQRIAAVVPTERLRAAFAALHGWDTDAAAIAACRARLDAVAAPLGIPDYDWNVRVRNSLHAFAGDPLFPAKEQFAVIVGNPPYVRIQHLSPADRALVRSRFSFCASGSTDLYIAFFELAFSLLTSTGKLGFITPNTYFHTTTGQALRHFLSSQHKLRHVVNFGHRQVFPDATTYAAITIAAATPAPEFVYEDAVREPSTSTTLRTELLARQDVWRFGALDHADQFADRQRYLPLREVARIHVGLATLADPVFIVQATAEPTAEGLLEVRTKAGRTLAVERALLRPIIKGSKVKVGSPCFTGAYIFFPYESIGEKTTIIAEATLAARYPLGYAYLLQMKDALDRRDNGRPNPAGWYAFGRSQALRSGFEPKIICPPMAPEPTFVVCPAADTTVYSAYFITYPGNLTALAAQLNSARMRDYMASGARDLLGGWKGYTKKAIQDFPIELAALLSQKAA